MTTVMDMYRFDENGIDKDGFTAENYRLQKMTPVVKKNPIYKGRDEISEFHEQLIINRLKKLGIDGKELCEQLIKHKALIAGSFPLQCLLGEEFQDSDVDIFIKMKIDIKLNEEGQVISHVDLSPIDKWIYNTYNIRAKTSPYILKDVLRSRKYTLENGNIINVIHVDTRNSLKEFIENTFDLSVCQTYFNGKELFFNELTLEKKGFIANLPEKTAKPFKPFYKKIDTDLAHYETKHLRHPSLCHLYPDMQKNLETRLEKYRKRGFEIAE